jgi:hypothetical protein
VKLLGLLSLWPPFATTPVGEHQSVHYSCLQAVQSTLQELSLPGITASNIVVMKFPWLDRAEAAGLLRGYPAVLVSPFGQETMFRSDGTNIRDDVTYPCLVVFIQAPDDDLQANQNRYLLWRQMTHRAFRNQNLPGVNEIITCRVAPREIGVQAEFVKGVWHSATVLEFISREVRGVGT